MKRTVAALLLLLVPLAQAAGERDKTRLETVREQRLALEKQVKQREAAHSATERELRGIEANIAESARQLRALGDEQAAARAERSAHERDLKRIEQRVAARQTELAGLLRHRMRVRETSALTAALAGQDPNAAMRDRYFLALLSRAQADMIADLRADAAETRRLSAAVRQRGQKLTELAQREQAERAQLQKHQQQRQGALSALAGQIDAQRRKIETLKQDEQRLGALLAALAKKQQQAKARQRAQARKPPPAPADGKTPAARPTPVNPAEAYEPAGGAFAQLRGRLTLPVQGNIGIRFGARRDAGGGAWKGIFVRAAAGAPVGAAAEGVVVFADWLRGYGQLLIVDHGDGFLSVYGNNQSLLAEVGQKVGPGKAIAAVGASGVLDESGLYFELRHRGQAIDPGRWFRSAP